MPINGKLKLIRNTTVRGMILGLLILWFVLMAGAVFLGAAACLAKYPTPTLDQAEDESSQ